jgi:Fe-S-cluster containining protein
VVIERNNNMRRSCGLDEISDGKLYDYNDLIEASCNGCKGGATCCHGMGSSIILDPYDIYQITTNLNTTFERLLAGKIELNVVDGIILPNLKMTGTAESCSFLNQEGKCSIHSSRPGICRIFPLGRYYENHDYKFFLQYNECRNGSSTKVKLNKWIDTPDYENNKKFLIQWHYFLNDIEKMIKSSQEDAFIKKVNMYLLNMFYIHQYSSELDFYMQFQERLSEVKKVLHIE